MELTEGVNAYLPALGEMKRLRTMVINRDSKGLERRFSEAAVVTSIGSVCGVERVVFTMRGTAEYVWVRRGDTWLRERTADACEVVGELWRDA